MSRGPYDQCADTANEQQGVGVREDRPERKVAVLHAARLFYGWPLVIASTQIPMAVSWVAVVVAGLMALAGFTSERG